MDAHRIGKRLVALRGARRREEVAKAVGVSFSALLGLSRFVTITIRLFDAFVNTFRDILLDFVHVS